MENGDSMKNECTKCGKGIPEYKDVMDSCFVDVGLCPECFFGDVMMDIPHVDSLTGSEPGSEPGIPFARLQDPQRKEREA